MYKMNTGPKHENTINELIYIYIINTGPKIENTNKYTDIYSKHWVQTRKQINETIYIYIYVNKIKTGTKRENTNK